MITCPTDKLQKVLLSGGCEQNGTPTPDNPIDIVCNNGVLKVSPNLFNKDLVPDENKYISKSGSIYGPSQGEYRYSDYITIKENTQYYVGIINSSASTAGLVFYDDTKTYISGMSLSELIDNNNIITSPSNTKYIRFSFRIDQEYNTNWQNTVYLIEGNQPLAEFMPYGQIYTQGTQEVVTDNLGNTANAEMLLAVGDYKDTQEVLNGSVTRNIGIKVLNGTEDWAAITRYCWNLISEITTTLDVYCTHFKMEATLPLANAGGSARWGKVFSTNYGLAFGARIAEASEASSTVFATVDDWNNYLADQYANGTPIIVVYRLAEPTTEQVTPQSLAGSSAIVTAGSIDNLPIESSTITELKKRYIGDKEVKKVYIGENLVYNINN